MPSGEELPAKAEGEEEKVRPDCHGLRLNWSLAVPLCGKNISELCQMSVKEELAFFHALKLDPRDEAIAHDAIREIISA